MKTPSRAVEKVARLSYGRLIAALAARFGAPHFAEDLLGDSLIAALETWPKTGVPDNPEAWLLTTAKRKAVDDFRRRKRVERHSETLRLLAEETSEPPTHAPDPRLNLMFVCAHPAIAPDVRAPLMLQLVLGLDARRIASVFLTSPGTLGQRLTRAKAKIETSRIPFEPPSEADFPQRLDDLLAAIYAAYAVGYDGEPVGDEKAISMIGEAIWLAGLICDALPNAAEAHGLMSLMLFSEARREARLDPDTGALTPLDQQNVALWSSQRLADAETALRNAAAHASLGRYQLEAAIQAVHCDRRRTGDTNWIELERLYRGLVSVSPTIGAMTGLAAVQIETQGPMAALAALEAIPHSRRATYQPWWATRAHALMISGDADAAREAYDKAIGLSDDAAARRFLARRRDGASSDPETMASS